MTVRNQRTLRHTKCAIAVTRIAPDAYSQGAESWYRRELEATMTNMLRGCSGWLMGAGGVVTYGTLFVVAAASVKYLCLR